jgi:predicted Na+-dependent transporter
LSVHFVVCSSSIASEIPLAAGDVMNRQDARTIAIEVGMQNGAMGTGIARSMGKLDTVGLAATIFGPLLNITGSVLANYCRLTADEMDPLK